ncbi:serine hydrolase [Flavobacterium phycosphaerae]|uniref:serine hydrolase n=1 Tax=Flavobacterium phycosphaerae TaxID=2697515 RepID=UPI00138AD4DF|nr:serine hydrolase [Flavobacterium phycosphaerae]
MSSPLASRKFSLFHVALSSIIISLFVSIGIYWWISRKDSATLAINSAKKTCEYNIKRITGLKFVKPILWVDENCESDNLVSTKLKITEIIEKYKQTSGLTTASIYLRANGEWTVVNEEDKYEPGSLFKVPVLITILKMEEEHPGFLNKSITYVNKIETGKNIAYTSKVIQLGQTYTVKELLTYMIKYSDNAATILLENNMDNKVLQKLFADVGVEVPNLYADKYHFTVRDYSLFMRIIFNAGYLTIKNSEYAAELLSECDFKDGIMKGIPANTKIAHKFGESGNPIEKQLHESAVIYLDNGAGYLLTVMTKGKDLKKLSELIGEISRTVYEDVKNQSK